MSKTIRQWLEEILEDLTEDQLRKFKTNLNEFPVKPGYDNIPRGRLQKADAMDLSDLLLGYYCEGYAVEVTVEVLRASNCKPQAERLAAAALPGTGNQASGSHNQHFIDHHREKLIQRTATVEPVLDRLYGTVLKEEQYQKICSKDTNQEKMRELYKLVPSWNSFCKDQLYDALKAANPFLIKDLGGK